MSLLKVNEIQIFNGTTVTITATTTETSADLNVGADLDVTGALTLGTALAIAEGGTGATDAATARTNLDVDQAGTDNSTDVTLVTTSHDYLSITGQAITLGPIDLAADVTGNLPYASISGTPTLGTAAAEDVGYFATAAQGSLADSAVQPGDDANTLGSGAATDGYVLTADGAGGAAWEAASGGGASLPIDLLSSGASIRKSDGTTAVLSESSGAVTLDNVTNAYLSGGIYFGTAGVTSGTGTETSNYLDDYEEGTWTPTLTTNGTDFGSVTYDSFTGGRYIKIGSSVTVFGTIRTDSVIIGLASGAPAIGNLPFQCVSHSGATRDATSVGAVYTTGWTTHPSSMQSYPGSTLALLYKFSSSDATASMTNVVPSDVGTGANANRIAFCLTYQTS